MKATAKPSEPISLEPQSLAGSLAITYRPLSSLKLYPQNARKHSEIQIGQICKSIERFGFYNPILVDELGTVRAGEGRYRAARRLSLEQVPTIRLEGLSDKQWQALSLADNRIAENSGWDEERLRQEITALAGAQVTIDDLGFSDAELKALLHEPTPLHVREIATGPVHDRFWISIRGELKHQAHVLAELKKVLARYEGVEVELGTISLEP